MKSNKKVILAIVLVMVSLLTFSILVSCTATVEYKVDFVVDGEVYHTINTAGETTIAMPQNPTKDGYTFDGWYWDENIWQRPFTANSLLEAPLSSDMKVFAKWKIENTDEPNEVEQNTYTISFIIDGKVYSSLEIKDDTTIRLPQDPTKEGYTFNGWYWDENVWEKLFIVNSLTNTSLTSNINVYAKFILEEERLGDLEIIAGSFELHDDKLSLIVDNAINSYSLIKEIIVKDTSKWELYFDIYCQSKIVSKTVSLDLGNNIFYLLVTDKNEDIKLYTVEIYRNKIILFNFNSNGGSLVESIRREENKEFGELGIPEKTGYTFSGWYLGETLIEETSIVEASKYYDLYGDGIDIEAHWQANTYTITYNYNDGVTAQTTQLVTYDSNVTLATPTKEGYTFLGWYNDTKQYTDGIWKTATNVALTASWIDNSRNPELDSSGNLISFTYGEYPQTIKANNITITSTEPEFNGYYLGSDNAYYVKVIATPFQNYGAVSFSNGETITSDEAYYFKVEPIKWKVLYNAAGTCTVISDLILDSQCYYNSKESRLGATDYQGNSTTETVYANNYKYSDIRTFLNTTFLNSAFTSDEQTRIQTTIVDNSYGSIYACENTQDKIFLLSYSEATNTDYGFRSDLDYCSSRGEAQGTDYAKAKGLMVFEGPIWWLRSPDYDYDYHACCVIYGGRINSDHVGDGKCGVRPVLNINL